MCSGAVGADTVAKFQQILWRRRRKDEWAHHLHGMRKYGLSDDGRSST